MLCRALRQDSDYPFLVMHSLKLKDHWPETMDSHQPPLRQKERAVHQLRRCLCPTPIQSMAIKQASREDKEITLGAIHHNEGSRQLSAQPSVP